MNYARIAAAAVGGTVAYFAAGLAMFMLFPQMVEEGRKYSTLFRPPEEQMARMPVIMAAIFVAIVALAVIYAMTYRGGRSLAQGARFGALVGVFVVCAFVIHNYVNFNFGPTLMLMQAGAYFVEWTAVGVVIGLVYKPSV